MRRFLLLLFALLVSISTYASSSQGCTSSSPCNYTYKNGSAYRMIRVQSSPGAYPYTLAPGLEESYQTYPNNIPTTHDACTAFVQATTLIYVLPAAPAAIPGIPPSCAFTIAMACGGEYINNYGEKEYWVGLVSNPTDPLMYCQNFKPGVIPRLQLNTDGYIATVNGKKFYTSITYTLQI